VNTATHALSFAGELLARGFWLYVWEIVPPDNSKLYYVGRTGDSSSLNAQSPFNRMGQHLSFNPKTNVLRRRLEALNINPETCAFRLVVHGPILQEASTYDEHMIRRDCVAAMEKALAMRMRDAGYHVINTVLCRHPLQDERFKPVFTAFCAYFEKLGSRSTAGV
jgi:hypothetical protein